MDKKVLRNRLIERLRRQPERQRLAKSLQIGRRVRRSALYRRAKTILCYVAIEGEVDTIPLLAQALADGKRVAVPVTRRRAPRLIAAEIKNIEKDLSFKGHFGIPQPTRGARRRIDPATIDLILVPGVAFEKTGRRLGRGGGYFDRFLSEINASVPRVGLAFRFQVVKKIPWEAHDQPVGRLITD